MGKKRITKLILFLIITVLVFQLIPNTLTSVDGLQSHTQNSKVFLSPGIINTDVLYIGRENQKTSIQKVQINNTSIGIPQIFIEDITVINFTFQEAPFDYRRFIRQSIPHYFSGGKYKVNHFAI